MTTSTAASAKPTMGTAPVPRAVIGSVTGRDRSNQFLRGLAQA